MIRTRRLALALVTLVASSATSAGAQPARAKGCTINDGTPYQINSGKSYLSRAMSTKGVADEKPKHLRDAVAAVEKAGPSDNPLGRNWVMGRALIWRTMLPGQTKMVLPRSEVGFTTDPSGTIDILMAADSAFSYVEQNAPQCADSIALFRQQPWVKLVNDAGAAVNAEKYDSAAYLARRSLIIYRNSPYAYNILAVIAQRKNDYSAALENYGQVVTRTAGDTATAVRRMRKDALYNSALLSQTMAADPAQSARRETLSKQVPDLWRAFLKEYPDDQDAKGALARSIAASGDTAAVAAAYAEMLATPSKFSDQQLVEAGVALANSNRNPDAIKLFAAALEQNPYNRDALFDLATTHYAAGNAAATRTYATRLLALDPSNPDNYRLLRGSYQLLAGESKDAKVKKAASDSLLLLMQKERQLPARVTFDQFNHNGSKHDLVGKIENLGATAAPFTLKVDFLDKSGTAVATQTAAIGAVGPKETKPFTVTATQAGIVAFRYALVQ